MLQRGTKRNIWSAEEFGVILKQELARASRYGHEFSVLVFNGTITERIEDLKRVLSIRIRSTDEAGWLDEQSIGVILPDTPTEGAREVAADLSQQMATGEQPASCRVYTYPSQWLSVSRTYSLQES